MRSSQSFERENSEYLAFWQKADTKLLEGLEKLSFAQCKPIIDNLRKLHRRPIQVPLGLKFRFVNSPANKVSPYWKS